MATRNIALSEGGKKITGIDLEKISNLKPGAIFLTDTGIKVNDIPVYTRKLLLISSTTRNTNWAFAAACKGKLSNNTDCYVIMVDDNFDQFSDETKRFLITHELGHCVLGHCDAKERYVKIFNLLRLFGYTPLEDGADTVARIACGFTYADFKKAMKELAHVSKKNHLHISKIDMISRLFTQKYRQFS